MKASARKYKAVDDAYCDLLSRPEIDGRSICFVGVPQEWFPQEGCAQTIWIKRSDDSIPVYHDKQMNVQCLERHTALGESILPDGDLVNVAVNGNSVYITSKNSSRAWIPTHDPFGREMTCDMGNRVVLAGSSDRAYDVRIEVDDRWMRQNPVFVSWDFENQKFKLVSR